MELLSLLLSVAALILAAMAFGRTGGMRDLRRQLDALSTKAESARELAANTIDKIEEMVRGGEKSTGAEKPGHGPTDKSTQE